LFEIGFVPDIQANGELNFIVCAANDITEQKDYEGKLIKAKDDAEAASKAKSQFLAMMSHEIRTPMNGIVWLTDLLLTMRMTPLQESYLQQIQISTYSLLNIINDILDFSKIEAGKLDIVKEVFDIRQLVNNSLKLVTHKANEKGLEMFCHISPEVPQYIKSDPLRINQILINFLSNALKFTEKGEILCRVSIEPNDRLKIMVKDSGIGISREKSNIIFDSFTQADLTTTRKYGGTGLGLSIAKQLSELLNGEIYFSSEVGKGSEFVLEIPYEKADNLIETEYKIEDVKRVLVVDDNNTNCFILSEIFKHWEISCDIAKSGKEALSKLTSHNNYDLIILDYQMPEMDGLETSERIKELSFTDIPKIFMLTSVDADYVRKRAQDLGINHFLTKPVLLDDLYKSIMMLSGKQKSVEDKKEKGMLKDKRQFEKKTILVAEDDEINMVVINTILEDLGFNCINAKNGRAAVEMYSSNEVDLVFMDLHMPEMDGIEATEEIRKLQGSDERVPVIALTADIVVSNEQEKFEKLFDNYITKPYRIEQIESLLGEFFKEIQGKTGRQEEVKGEAEMSKDVIFDTVEFMGLVSNDIDFAKELIDRYIENSDEYIRSIKDKILSDEEQAELIEIVHKFKGLTANIRANRLFKILDQLNYMLKIGNSTEEVLTIFEIVYSIYLETIESMKNFIKELGVKV
jgi:CheY-like chemotaxis protein/nitrogen-specific signal transduction histidine kinase